MQVEHMPGYLAGPDGDPLMIVMAVIFIAAVLIAGVLYFKLHAVPEHIAHGKNHTQMQLIAILTMLALFTHNNMFWVAALVLAVVELPDFISPLKSIARSLEIIAKGEKSGREANVEKSKEAQAVDTDNDSADNEGSI